jgi:hypothetical protein
MIDDKPQPPGDIFDIVEQGFSLIFNDKRYFTRTTNMHVGAVFEPGYQGCLFYTGIGPNVEKLQSSSTRMTVEICYCNIYDKCWLSSDKSGWGDQDREDDSCSTFSNQPRSDWWQG